MKILACGDRDWGDHNLIHETLAKFGQDTILVVGGARGADTIAENCGHELGFTVLVFPANWDQFGKRAGPIRNRQMLNEKPDLVIAFHDDLQASKGTKDTVTEAHKRNIKVQVVTHGGSRIGFIADTSQTFF
jgi:hypothetical protein